MSVLAATLLAASAALASGLNLAWDKCASDGGVSNRSAICDTNLGANTLVGSFVLAADEAGVTGLGVVVDLIVGDGTSTIPTG